MHGQSGNTQHKKIVLFFPYPMVNLQYALTAGVLCIILSMAHLAAAQSVVSYDDNLITLMRAFGVKGEPVDHDGIVGMSSMVSMFDFPELLSREDYLSFPMMVTSVCIAYNLPGAKDPYTTVQALQDFMWGRSDSFMWDGDGTKMPASQTQFVLPTDSSTNIIVGRALGVEPPDHIQPASMYNRPHVRAVIHDEDVANSIASISNTVGPIPLQVAKMHDLPCVAVGVVDANGAVVKYDAELPMDSKIEVDTDTLIAVPKKFFSAYPIIGVMTLHTRKDLKCDEARPAISVFQRLAASRLIDLQKELWGFVSMPPFLANKLLHTMLDQHCPDLVIYSSGTSVTKDLISKASLSYNPRGRHESERNYTVLYGSGGSGTGIRDLKAGTVPFAGSDAQLSDLELAEFPSLKFAPLAAFSVCISVPRKLVIPKCVVPALYNGSITHWDHPALQEANLFVKLPHTRIETMGVTTRSGTTEVFQRALRFVQEECDGHSNIEVSGYYKLPATHYVPNKQQILPALRANPNLLSYASWNDAVVWGIPYAVVQMPSGQQVTPRPEDVVATLQDAMIDERTSYVTVQLTDRSYPFVGMSYVIVDTRQRGSATQAKYGIDFLKYLYTDEAVPQMFNNLWLVRPSAAMREVAMAVLNSVQVNGQPLYPKPKASDDGLSGGAIAGIVIGALIATGLLVLAVVRSTMGRGRDVRYAPKDDTAPFAVMFTDVQNSTALWAREPEVMNNVLNEHNEVLRRLIAQHKCYEVKTIGDAFMVVGSSPTSVLRLALDAQDALHDAPLAKEAINATYAELEAERESGQAMVNVAKNPVPFNGLRVRIGLHLGMGSIQEMPETGAYDYLGTVVNTAARVEAAGHGGQVVATEEFCAGMPTTELEGIHMAFLGSHTLRGLDAPHSLHLLARTRFAGRVYPPLRLDLGAKDETEEGNDEPADGGQDGTSSHHSGTTRDSRATSRTIVTAFQAGLVIQRTLAVYKAADRTHLIRELCNKWHVGVREDEDDTYSALGEKIGRMINVRRRSSIHGSEAASDTHSHRASSVLHSEHSVGDLDVTV